MDSDTETMVDTDLDSAERDLPMPNLNLMPMLTLMPKLTLFTDVVLDSMVGLAKDMVDTEDMVFNKQHTDSEPIPIMVDTDVLWPKIWWIRRIWSSTSSIQIRSLSQLWWIRTSLWRLRTILVRNLSSSNELCSILHSSYSIEQY